MVANAPPSAVIVIALAIALAAVVVGCSPVEKIEQYRVDKPEALAEKYFKDSAVTPASSFGSDRMLAAIVPHGSQFWFFKLVGPERAVKDQASDLGQFLASLHFAGDGDSPPDWTLPEGWKRQPGNQVRYATLKIDSGSSALEVSVTTFPKPANADEMDEAELMNVNRWRNQLGLSPIVMDDLGSQAKLVKLAGEPSVFVDLVGKLGKGGMGSAPFAGGSMPPGHPELPPDHPALPADHPAIPKENPTASSNPPPEAPTDLKFDTPAGWQAGQLSDMRKAAFVVDDGKQKIEITVVALPPFAGDLLANVNRWRGQLHLPETTADELTKQVKPLSIGGTTGSFIELVGPADPVPQQTILGALVSTGDHVWFMKLIGDAKLAEREKPKFESFLKSIKFAAK